VKILRDPKTTYTNHVDAPGWLEQFFDQRDLELINYKTRHDRYEKAIIELREASPDGSKVKIFLTNLLENISHEPSPQ